MEKRYISSEQINQEWLTVTEPFYRSLLLYFMLSTLLFSLEQDTNLFHQWFSCWPCRLVYLQPPLNFLSYEVIASWGETWEDNNIRSDGHWESNWQNDCSKDLPFVIKRAQRRASFQKHSLQTAFRGKMMTWCSKSAFKKWLQLLQHRLKEKSSFSLSCQHGRVR